MDGRVRTGLLCGTAGAIVATLLVLTLAGGGVAGAQDAASEAPRQIVGGSMDEFTQFQTVDGFWDAHMGLFGWAPRATSVKGWSRVPVDGTIANFSATLPTLPARNTEENRYVDVSVTFTLFCKAPAGSASSCSGLGPGPVETSVSCRIRQLDYVNVTGTERQDLTPFCVDSSKPKSFDFVAGEWLMVRYRATPHSSLPRYAQWTAAFGPAS